MYANKNLETDIQEEWEVARSEIKYPENSGVDHTWGRKLETMEETPKLARSQTKHNEKYIVTALTQLR